MDLTLIFATVSGLVIIVLFVFVFFQYKKPDEAKLAGVRRPQPALRDLPRRAVGARNARVRLRAAAGREDEEEDDAEERAAPNSEIDDSKMGAKKRAKLEAKAEKKAQREVQEREREEKKRKKELLDEERKKAEFKEKLEEEKRLEQEKKEKEEKERQEYEEYLKLKEAFSIEQEGYDESESEENKSNLLQDFISYIQTNKVVVLEDLAATFKLKTQFVIDRIQDLQTEGRITGVIDDRGKFIYISQEELEAVAKFVKQRGRVSLTELAENSNRLVTLVPSA
ncbi:DDRGK domain-containing protein 1 [Macrosteles quadrilineatus]|uniref:DDRGK domain-containing protein 1 n=1 Tax=Macrosteles quadrilineatus TaxID=74068 RepID=UPI0023E2CDE9|nr:DDRGK domain-containing protein 1 [Macrosteles quadrilineatus]